MHQLDHAGIDALLASIPIEALTDRERSSARSLLSACLLAIVDDAPPGEVIARMSHAAEYGPWLDPVRAAIDSADLSEKDHAALRAAFRMATVILYDVTDRRRLLDRRFL